MLWGDFDAEVAALQEAFQHMGDDVPLMTAIRQVVVGVNQHRAEAIPELRARINLINAVPALHASAAPHYDAWERAVAAFAAARLGQPADSLYPLAIGRATLAACRAAYERWLARADHELTVYLDLALRALDAGFAGPAVTAQPPCSRTRARNRSRRQPRE